MSLTLCQSKIAIVLSLHFYRDLEMFKGYCLPGNKAKF